MGTSSLGPAQDGLACRKVVGLGLARTGTTSLHNALVLAGLNSAPSSAVLLDAVGAVERLDLGFLAGHDAFFDNPVPFLARELDSVLPDARFVITWRPCDEWLGSMQWLFGPGMERLDRRTRRLGHHVHRVVYGTDRFDENVLAEIHGQHYEWLRSWSKDRDDVLWLDLRDGLDWEPLSGFIDVVPPELPFPHSNSSNDD